MPKPTIAELLKKHTDRLMAIPGVVGVGEGESKGKPCIRVFVGKKNHKLMKSIPSSLEGYQVIVDESGQFHAVKSP
jgi:hypothetical protein